MVMVKLSLKMRIIYIYVLINRYRFRNKHRRATYNMFLEFFFSRDSICLYFEFIRRHTEVIFKINGL